MWKATKRSCCFICKYLYIDIGYKISTYVYIIVCKCCHYMLIKSRFNDVINSSDIKWPDCRNFPLLYFPIHRFHPDQTMFWVFASRTSIKLCIINRRRQPTVLAQCRSISIALSLSLCFSVSRELVISHLRLPMMWFIKCVSLLLIESQYVRHTNVKLHGNNTRYYTILYI